MPRPSKGERTPGSGRKKGTPNKATADTRAAMVMIAEGNAHKVQGWLDRIARKSPARALDLYLRIVEFTVPKLARAEVTGPGGGPFQAETYCIVVPQKAAIGYGAKTASEGA